MKKTNITPEYRTKSHQAYVEAWDVCVKMKRLAFEGNRKGVIPEVLKHLRISEQQKFYKLAAEFAICLHHHYSNSTEQNKTKAKRYYELSVRYTELSYVENMVRLKFSYLSKELNSTRNPDPKLVQQLKDTITEFTGYKNQETAFVKVIIYNLLNQLDYIEGRFEAIVKRSYEAIDFFEQRGIDRSAVFYKDMAPALMRCGQYEEASAVLEKAMLKTSKNSTIWSVLTYYQLVLELHRKDYAKAYGIFQRAEKGRHIHKDMLETWRFVRGYIKFLIEVGKMEGTTHFKLGKFLNSLEVFAKDKKGQNINAIILKVLLRIQSKRGLIVEDREKVERYAIRYLEKGSRERLFFNMLHQLVPGRFEKELVATKAAKYLARLPKQDGYNADLEILPYEDLWEMVLGILD